MGKRKIPPEEKNKLSKTIYAVCEGHRTEFDYLSCFESKRSMKGHFGFKNLKESFEMDNTDRHELFEIIDGRLIELSKGELTPFQYVTKVLKKYADLIGLSDVVKALQRIFKSFVLLCIVETNVAVLRLLEEA